MEGIPVNQLLLWCENCGTLQHSYFHLAMGANIVKTQGCVQGCIRCHYPLRVPDGGTAQGIFYGLVADATNKVMQSANPVSQAESLVSALRPLATPSQIDAAMQSPELAWLRPHLPASREEWVLFVQTTIALMLALLAWINLQPTGTPLPTPSVQSIIDCYNKVSILERSLVLTIVAIADKAWKTTNPRGFLLNLRQGLQECVSAGLYAGLKPMPWIKAISPQTPEEFGSLIREILAIFLAEKLFERWSKKEKPTEGEIAEIVAEVLDERERRKGK
ncbi:MAG: hypothetical protein JWL69_3250 [Phycisphaerales bacterium]|nr:hypothetical protein [Phycisphaerales bacterium]